RRHRGRPRAAPNRRSLRGQERECGGLKSCAMSDRDKIDGERAHHASNCSASRRFHGSTPVRRACPARPLLTANPEFRTELVGQPWDFEQKRAFAASGHGSAPHLSVTALSVKKALTVYLQVKKTSAL